MAAYQRKAMRRGTASFVLTVFMFVAFAPLLYGTLRRTADCPLGASGNVPTMVAAMDDGACGHLDAGLCVIMACSSGAPAIQPAAVSLISSGRFILLQAPANVHVGDLFRTGPPTPPPNQI